MRNIHRNEVSYPWNDATWAKPGVHPLLEQGSCYEWVNVLELTSEPSYHHGFALKPKSFVPCA